MISKGRAQMKATAILMNDTADRDKVRRTANQFICILCWIVGCLLFVPGAWAVDFSQSAHGNRASMPKSCGSCHVGHGKKRTPMLPFSEEDLCYECHGGQARAEAARRNNRLGLLTRLPDISAEFKKPYHHPVEISGAHNPREHAAVPVLNPERHSECVDCHHHHRTERKPEKPGRVGMAKKKSPYNRTEFEHKLCYQCHGKGSLDSPLSESTDPEVEFNVGNPSYHPVEAEGKNQNVPSLILPLTEQSLINCTDCHNNNDPNGPQGPHGSIYDPILVRFFNQEDESMESELQYALCYDCHARSSILGNQGFTKHSLHIVEERTSCHTCHNAHGSPFNTHLIFFNTREVVSPSSSGRLEFIDLGNLSGQCYLTCHGENHNPLSYP
jgi:predicted CXXCH cytochrome family protein